jgi:hypothetical protein
MKDTVAYTLQKGRPMTWTIAATAGNVAINLTPGNGYQIEILYGRLQLVTDITVANRTLVVNVQNATGGILTEYGWSAGIPASTTLVVDFNNLLPNNTGWTTPIESCTFNDRIRLYDGDRIVITIGNGVVGDAYQGFFKYLLVKR